VHAKGVRAIANAAVKTDQIDASTLAHLARLRGEKKTTLSKYKWTSSISFDQ
jgi:hypothetical protein